MLPIFLIHMHAITIDQLPVLVDDPDKTKGTSDSPTEYGFYYEFMNEHFNIIKHSSEEPYESKPGSDYAGPINPHLFLEFCSNSSGVPFIGIPTETPVKVSIVTAVEEVNNNSIDLSKMNNMVMH